MDVREHTTVCDGNVAEELVQLFVVADSELDVAWNDASLLVITSCISGKLQNLGSKVLEDG